MILAIDPGCMESAYVLMNYDLKPIEFGKVPNNEIFVVMENPKITHVAIEMVASYGMPVGQEVFETCVWIGRYIEHLQGALIKDICKIYRKTQVAMNLCHSMKAKDSNVMHALIDRFAEHDFKNGKGTKKNPDYFYGFSADIWSAYAVGVTYSDLFLQRG